MVKIASCLATLLSVANAWKQKGVYFEKNFNWAAMEDDIIAAMQSVKKRPKMVLFSKTNSLRK